MKFGLLVYLRIIIIKCAFSYQLVTCSVFIHTNTYIVFYFTTKIYIENIVLNNYSIIINLYIPMASICSQVLHEISGSPYPFRCPILLCIATHCKTQQTPIHCRGREPCPVSVHFWNPDITRADLRHRRRTADRFGPAAVRISRSTPVVSWRSTCVWCGPVRGRHGISCDSWRWPEDRSHCDWWGPRFLHGSAHCSCRNNVEWAARRGTGC